MPRCPHPAPADARSRAKSCPRPSRYPAPPCAPPRSTKSTRTVRPTPPPARGPPETTHPPQPPAATPGPPPYNPPSPAASAASRRRPPPAPPPPPGHILQPKIQLFQGKKKKAFSLPPTLIFGKNTPKNPQPPNS